MLVLLLWMFESLVDCAGTPMTVLPYVGLMSSPGRLCCRGTIALAVVQTLQGRFLVLLVSGIDANRVRLCYEVYD